MSAASAVRAAWSLQTAEEIPRRVWVRLAVVYLILGAGAWIYAEEADAEGWWLHGVWCFGGLGAALPTLSIAFRRGFGVVLTDHRLMFLASFSLYFLFGASLLAVGPDAQIEASLSYYPVSPGDALRADAINGLGFGIALLTAALARGRFLGTQAALVATQAARIPAHWAIRMFLAIGVAASLYTIPFDLGFVEGLVPGTVRSASKFSLVAIYLASAHRGSGESSARLFGAIVAVTLALVGILMFSKSGALMPLAALVAGLAMRFGSRRVLLPGVAVLVTIYMMLGSITTYGRIAVTPGGSASFMQRWQLLQEGWVSTQGFDDDEGYGYWSRLCYVPAQVAALRFQDAGQGGDGLTLMFWVFVPRVLFPEKPEITKTGREFHEKITGSDTSATGEGIFASGYYHGGWLGFVLASALCGWILAQTSAIARASDKKGGLFMLPFSLLGLVTAFRIDGDFVADYLGTFVFILYPILLAAVVMPAVSSTIRRTSAPSG